MAKYRKLSHTVYQCNYHVVFTPKYRYRILEGKVKDIVEHKIRQVCEWYEVEIEEMNIQTDHIHMLLSIPPQAISFRSNGDNQGQECDSSIQDKKTLERKALLGQSFLGSRLFCNHCWSRRRNDPAIYPASGERREAA